MHEGRKLFEPETFDDGAVRVDEREGLLDAAAEKRSSAGGIAGAHKGHSRIGLLEDIEDAPRRLEDASALVGVWIHGDEGQVKSGQPGPQRLRITIDRRQQQIRGWVDRHRLRKLAGPVGPSGRYRARVHPIELLRHVARSDSAWADDAELAADAAVGLAALSHEDPAAMVTACARMRERHPECQPLHRACERMLQATDAEAEAHRILGELDRLGTLES